MFYLNEIMQIALPKKQDLVKQQCIESLHQVRSLPHYLTSDMANIHLLAVAYSADIKEYSFDPILECIIADVKVLERDGIEVDYNGTKQKIFGSLAILTGDNLARHMIMGFAQSFNAQ